MKKIFFSFVALVAMFLMTGCGGSDGGSSSGGYSGGGNYSECFYGSYQCKGGDSYWCGYVGGSNDLTWQLSEYCSYSCDDSTGKCSSSSGGGNSGDNSSGDNSGGNSGGSNSAYQTCCDLAYCFDACSNQNCYDNCVANSSSSAINGYNDIFYCGDTYGCDPDGDGYYDSSCLSTYCASYLTNCCYEVDNGGGSTSECSSGQHMCNGSYSYYCSGGYWDSGTYCSNGCNSSTGQCNSSSGGGSTTECTSGQYRCNGNTSFYCSGGKWDSGTYCSDGCNSSTGKCKSSSSSSCTSGQYKCQNDSSYKCSSGSWTWNQDCSNGCDLSKGKCYECSTSDYKCSGSTSYYCNSGYWVSNESCSKGCDSSTGKCKGYKPCISYFSGLSTSSSINLSWSTTTSGNCSKAEEFTIYWYDLYDDYYYYDELSGSSSSYTLNAKPYLSSETSSIVVQLDAENSYGKTSSTLTCAYVDSMGWFNCK